MNTTETKAFIAELEAIADLIIKNKVEASKKR